MPELRPGLRAAVQAEDCLNHAAKLRRNVKTAAALPVRDWLSGRASAGDETQLGAEGAGQGARGAGDSHAPRGGIVRCHLNFRLALPEHPGHQLVVGRVRPVAFPEF